MRNVLTSLIMSTLAASIVGCSANMQEAKSKEASSPVIELGMTQIVDHPALNSIRQGITDALSEEGFQEGKNLNIDFQNAQGEINNTIAIAQQFSAENKDLVIAITTPSAQAVAQHIKHIPLVFGAVTDPVAAGLVTSLNQVKHMTGTSDVVSMEKQLDLILQFVPELKTLGVVYTTSEVNAEVQVKQLEKVALQKGIALKKAGITNSSEVKTGTESIIENVEALFIPVDNTVVSAVDSVMGLGQQYHIPVFASDRDTVQKGAVATYGIDYYKMGKQTGKMVSRILKGETIQQNPVETSKEHDLIINEKAANSFGIQVPAALLKQAKELFK